MLDLATAIRTTGAVRRFTPESIDDETLYALLDDARFAPSGGNRQSWRVVVVKHTAIRVRLGELMQPVWDEYSAIGATGRTPFAVAGVTDGDVQDLGTVPNDLLAGISDIPVVLVVAADMSKVSMMDKDLGRPTITGGASIYPFCWNLLLAARSRGLGGVLTTFLARAEPGAAELLDLPATYAIAATLFLGHPVHQPTKLSRLPVEAFTTVDTFAGPVFARG